MKIEAPNRPKQDRSRASLERLLTATRKLMLERGDEEFTLLEVAQAGGVSTGTIYQRFESKDSLVRTVILDFLDTIRRDEVAMIRALVASNDDLAGFVWAFIRGYETFLADHAALMRLCIARAEFDPLVSAPGKETARSVAAEAVAAIMTFAQAIAGPDKRAKAQTCYQIIFATLARQMGIGTTQESRDRAILDLLGRELGKVCLAYLTAA